MKVIIVTGSVGTGKTELSRKLSKKLNSKYINVNQLIEKHKLSSGYDKKRKCKIIDTKKLNKVLINLIKESKENIIIDSHLSHYLPKKYVDLCIVTKCSLKALNKRLKKRKYTKPKIRENMDCEIFNICLNEAIERKHRTIVVLTTKRLNMAKIAGKVNKQVKPS